MLLISAFLAGLVALVAVLARAAATRSDRERFKRPTPASLLLVLGSGGHTTELLSMASTIDLGQYPKRTWLAFSGDALSLDKARHFEEGTGARGRASSASLRRARGVGQSYFTSIFTSLWCGFECLRFVYRTDPDVILCNGPGSCVLVCAAARVLRAVGAGRARIIYVESIARVSSLSLTGKLLVRVADRFIVQWEQLRKAYPTTEYLGVLV
ncbi:udp-n-acetylglucosamine transferase subunitalg14 [Dipodascopsis tothii]|uniref:udp-n-acetylglucosamine transferase subunitalg14 n=1 Tax=Dipodascopsis tothii TaxID=44089 RepID=UPI0034CE3F50